MERPSRSRSRRDYLRVTGSAATVGLTALAGCSALGDSESPDASEASDEKFSRPTLPDEAMNSLEQTGEIRQVSDATGMTAYTAGQIYEVTDLTERVTEKTMGNFSDPLMVFFAAKTNLEGLTTAAASPERIADSSKTLVERRLNDQGVEDTREVKPAAPLPDYSSSETVEFRGTYRTPEITQQAQLGNGETLPIEIPAQDLSVAGMMTVWKQDNGTALLAGGGYPAEDYEYTTETSMTSDLGDGIDVSVSIDLNLQPESLRKRLNELTEAVS